MKMAIVDRILLRFAEAFLQMPKLMPTYPCLTSEPYL